MKKIHIFLGSIAALATLWLILGAACGILATEWALHPGRRALGAKDIAHAQAVAARNHAILTEVSLSASDGTVLRAWSLRPLHGNGDVVLLLHGHTDNRTGMLGHADLLLRHGYAVLLPDARAHGASGGALATYGFLEADDVRRWFDWIENTETPHCVDGLGESMGAAQLLQSLRTMPGFCAVVAESPFASFREASYDRLGEKLHSGAWAGRTLLRPAVEAGFLYARRKYGRVLEDASPEDAVASTHVPVLLIHGRKDANLSSRHSAMILARNPARTPAVQLWQPAEAGHCGAASSEPAEFERRVIGWFAAGRRLRAQTALNPTAP